MQACPFNGRHFHQTTFVENVGLINKPLSNYELLEAAIQLDIKFQMCIPV